MKIINAGYFIESPDLDDPNCAHRVYKKLEKIGRICYQSESQGTDESAENFVRRLIKRGHEAMLEHDHMTVIFTVDRGISHEIVRHRIASFAQESTRYCNYSKDKFGNEITVIEPYIFKAIPSKTKEEIKKRLFDGEERIFPDDQYDDLQMQYVDWLSACHTAENNYINVTQYSGMSPEMARSVLPTSLKTTLAVTTNFREWRHILNLRAAGVTGKPHPQMLEVMVPLLNELRLNLPALFDDIQPMEE